MGPPAAVLGSSAGCTTCTSAPPDLGRRIAVPQEYGRAGGYYGEALTLGEQTKDRPSVAFVTVGLAECAAADGQPERAARLYGAADAVFASVGMSFRPYHANASFHEHYASLAREQLGDEAFEAARAEGRAMSFDQAVEYARSTT